MIILHTLISDHKGAGRRTLEGLCLLADQWGEEILLSADSNMPSKGFDHSYEKTAALVDFYYSYGFRACDDKYWDGEHNYQVNAMKRTPRMLCDPYESEWSLYEKTPANHRWIYNKLDLSERLGQEAYPTGSKVGAGTYCIRPIMNLQGMAAGGFRKIVLDAPGFIQQPPGYVVTPWLDEPRYFYECVDDVCRYAQVGIREGNVERYEPIEPAYEVPEALKGISRYMLIECLGDTVIDVGPRLIVEEMRQEIVEEHQQLVDDYEPPEYGEDLTAEESGMEYVERDDGWWSLRNKTLEQSND